MRKLSRYHPELPRPLKSYGPENIHCLVVSGKAAPHLLKFRCGDKSGRNINTFFPAAGGCGPQEEPAEIKTVAIAHDGVFTQSL
jgi:hypothetical protein